jgi:acyl carrier protein
MHSESTQAVVYDALLEVCGLSGPIDDAARLEDLGIDSLAVIEVGMIVEERLGVVLDANDFEGVATFGEVVAVFHRGRENDCR